MHISIHTYTHTHMYLWTQESDKPWDYPDQCIFLSLMGALSSQGVPQQGQERGDGAGGKIGIILCREEGFFPPPLSAVVLQLSLREARYGCLTASFPRCSLNEKRKKGKEKSLGMISNICYPSLKAFVLLSGHPIPLGSPSFGKSHAS